MFSVRKKIHATDLLIGDFFCLLAPLDEDDKQKKFVRPLGMSEKFFNSYLYDFFAKNTIKTTKRKTSE